MAALKDQGLRVDTHTRVHASQDSFVLRWTVRFLLLVSISFHITTTKSHWHKCCTTTFNQVNTNSGSAVTTAQGSTSCQAIWISVTRTIQAIFISSQVLWKLMDGSAGVSMKARKRRWKWSEANLISLRCIIRTVAVPVTSSLVLCFRMETGSLRYLPLCSPSTVKTVGPKLLARLMEDKVTFLTLTPWRKN